MSESAIVPLIVVSSAREPVEAVNALLRREGIAARCTWVAALNDLPDTLTSQQVELLLCVPTDHLGVADVATMSARGAPGLPVLVLRAEITEDLLTADLAAGARDTINLAQPRRAHHVIARELHGWRLQRAHVVAQDAVRESQKQLDSVFTRSNDAILDVQEGILVEANQSWLDLIGADDVEAVVGQPVMDAFHQESQIALKGALTACLRGQWKDHALKVAARSKDGGSVPVELLLTLGERDGESCVRIMVPISRVGGALPVHAEPSSTAVADAPAAAIAAGAVATPHVPPASIPVGGVPSGTKLPDAVASAPVDLDEKASQYDAVWMKHIQLALVENRFRLVQQPITNLAGGPPMFDLLIRMLDRQRREILPNEFLPAAERSRLMGPIDRWVISAAARFAVEAKPDCLFVRLSQASAIDEALPRWLMAQIANVGFDPKQLCLTVTEAVATSHLEAVRRQAHAIKSLGMRFALEHFGTGPDPLALLLEIPMDFCKIDGRLIQGVKGDSLVQSKVEALVEAARERNVESIAPNVEDANTMAVLWQLGVQHLEGFLIQKPEEVILT